MQYGFAEGQSVFVRHSTQKLFKHFGVLPPQLAFERHSTQACLGEHIGADPPQSLSTTHPTHS